MIERTNVSYESQKPAALKLLNSTNGIFGMNPLAALLAHAVLQKYPKHRVQLENAANEMGVDVVDVTLANISYDLLFGLMGCSTMALAGPDGPMIVRNMDWFPADQIAKATTIVPTDHGKHVGFPGMVGVVTGMSNRGFGFALNAVHAGQPNIAGYPVLLFLRNVLDNASSYQEARSMIENEQLMSGGLITLVGKSNDERCVIERCHKQSATRTPEGDEALVTTNHYRAVAVTENCPRYHYMKKHVGTVPPLEILENENVMQTITSQHIVVKPNTGELQAFVPQHLLESDDEELTPELIQMMLGSEVMQL